MKQLLWKAVAGGLGVGASILVRRLTASMWPGSGEPPRNPADRGVDWTQALGWAVASGIGAGLARTVSRRTAAAGWSKIFDEAPPGVTTSVSPTT